MTVGEIENGVERGFIKHRLKSSPHSSFKTHYKIVQIQLFLSAGVIEKIFTHLFVVRVQKRLSFTELFIPKQSRQAI